MSDYIIPGRAYTPEQKRDIIEKLLKIWLDAPTLRLGQLMYIVSGSSFDSPTFFYMEDEALITELEKHIIPPTQTKSDFDITALTTHPGITKEELVSLSEGILKLAEEDNNV